LRALRSVLSQTLGDLELIVVIDGPDTQALDAVSQTGDSRVRVLSLPASLGCGGARRAGFDAARGRWFAWLDDDDEWMPEKLASQLETAKKSRFAEPIISCRLIGRSEKHDYIWPRRLPGEGEPISEYIFCRKRLLWGDGLVQSSTLFSSSSLMRAVPIRAELRKHEDYDWLLRACARDGTGLEFVAEETPLSIWHNDQQRDRMSTKAKPDWRSSHQWIQDVKPAVTPRAYASFLLNHLSLKAVTIGDFRALPQLFTEALRHGRPGISDILVFISNCLLPIRLHGRLGRSFARLSRSLRS
jgi:glycosyltransferase involved in cell wall biosynthesis